MQSTALQTQPFSARVQLVPGENVIVVTAVDAAGRTVFRDVTQAAGGGTVGANLGTGDRWAVVIGIAISTRTRRSPLCVMPPPTRSPCSGSSPPVAA